jgi:membrane protein implicated in regulation of membrane protease activity
MGKLIAGLIILGIWVLGSLGGILALSTSSPSAGGLTKQEYLSAAYQATAINFFIFAIPGALLIYFGYKSLKRERAVISMARQLLEEEGKLNANSLSERVGIKNDQCREVLVKAQRKGRIPSQAEITW